MKSQSIIGEVLEGKYQIESVIGHGGMGTVYFANHVGTERPVAVKIISSEFMQRTEFIERFRREARAAGRLRHPNVVDVTDFGLAETKSGSVAYLVMEYLDGCTLGEILEEERSLPLTWSLDILEQVCSAVQAAHEQGIIHRDLKPDNIWLEPNQRGGYTVKVLDFGIAKLEESIAPENISAGFQKSNAVNHTQAYGSATEPGTTPTLASEKATGILQLERQTILQPVAAEQQTLIQPVTEIPEHAQTAILPTGSFSPSSMSRSSSELTRVGAVLGTPLYMSPEQCCGEHLDARSDVYSLGVIAYQLVAGKTPFDGDYTRVMQSHKECEPPKIQAKIRQKVKNTIFSALAKDPKDRPDSAEAFAAILRANSEGAGVLMRKSMGLWSENYWKYLLMAAFYNIPLILLTLIITTFKFLSVFGVIESKTATVVEGVALVLTGVFSVYSTYLAVGTTTLLVTHSIAVPLRPFKLRSAIRKTIKRWKPIAITGTIHTIAVSVIGIVTCGLGFLVLSIVWGLVGPIVMMERMQGIPVLRRSYQLFKRSVLTAIFASLLMFAIPAFGSGFLSVIISVAAHSALVESRTPEMVADNLKRKAESEADPDAAVKDEEKVEINFGKTIALKEADPKTMKGKVIKLAAESMYAIGWLPLHVFTLSFTCILLSLLYLKTRQAGGESLQELTEQFDDNDTPKTRWQVKVQNSLRNPTRTPSKP